MAEKLARTRAKSGGNRSVMTKLSNEASELLQVEPINKQRLKFIAASLNEKLNLVKTFDDEIIENYAVGETEAEIQESDEINSRVMDPLRLINEATKTFRLSQLRMSAKLLALVRMQTKLRPLVFHNRLQLSVMFGTLLLFWFCCGVHHLLWCHYL